jgi:hypothetical protein
MKCDIGLVGIRPTASVLVDPFAAAGTLCIGSGENRHQEYEHQINEQEVSTRYSP